MGADILKSCTLCPRRCGIDRTRSKGFCGEGDVVRIARAEKHMWEEPCISGDKGSGTVFFSGCCLRCCFCQNFEISAQGKGFELTVSELAQTFLRMQDMGAHNVNLVSPTHFVPQIVKALELLGGQLKIPVVYNCGGYENVQTLKMLGGRVKIFLPDVKYFDSELSRRYSAAADYFTAAMAALQEMIEIAGKPEFDEHGIMQSGVIVRHLVLPNHRHDSIRLVNELAQRFGTDKFLISLMSQFVPMYKAFEHKELSRRTSTFEYNSVADEVRRLGFEGYFQQRDSASEGFVPTFYDKKYF